MIQPIQKNNPALFTALNGEAKTKPESKTEQVITDSIEISNTAKAFAKVEQVLDLNNTDRLNISDLNPDEKKEFLKMLANTMKEGIVGYETLKVDGQAEKHFIVNEIGDQRLKGAKPYKKQEVFKTK